MLKIILIKKETISSFITALTQLSSQIKDDYWTLDNYEMDLPEKWNLSYMVVEESTLIGFVFASVKNKAIHINRLVVDGTNQGRGLGKKLLDLITSKCLEHSLNQITLKVQVENISAINWYFRNGFCIAGKTIFQRHHINRGRWSHDCSR